MAMELTDKNYETIIKKHERPVFIDFYSLCFIPNVKMVMSSFCALF